MASLIWVSTRKGLFTVERVASTHWEVARHSFLGDNVSLVLPNQRDRSVYAALDHGHFGTKLHRSRDGGATWEEIGVPTYPKQPEGEIAPPEMGGPPIAWKLGRIWALEAGHYTEPHVLWCGTSPGGLFRSTDHGATWELNRPLWDDPRRKQWFGGGTDLPALHSISVDPRDARRLVVAVSCGGVWATDDGGASWDCRAQGMWASYMPPERKSDPAIQDPHCVVRCRTQPDCLWAQHHNGVFRTTDGCASWHEVLGLRPSSFGFAVAVHPHDPQTAWFVPAISDEKRIPVDAKVVVTRTRDGGQTCDVLTAGLPQENAFDLTFRHGLAVDGTGQILAFGSTTGSLWVSDDGGDHWQTVATNLPPIHAVRFASA